MNAALVINLPALAAAPPPGTPSLWSDEARVNAIWNGILNSIFPTTGAPGSFLICPEMRKPLANPTNIADLAVTQLPVAPFNMDWPFLCFEGKSSIATDAWSSVQNQISSWVTRTGATGHYRVWGISAKGQMFEISACNKGYADRWMTVNINNNPPTFIRDGRRPYDLTNAAHIALLNAFLLYIQAPNLPTMNANNVD